MTLKQGVRARLTRAIGMTRKELLTVIRQPRLIVMLIAAPFLILLVFGLGYRQDLPPFRTLIVLESEEAALAADLDDLSDSFGADIDLVGTTADAEEGANQLESGEIDLMIVAPEGAVESIEAGEKADFAVVHAEVDPVMVGSIELLSRLSVDEINRRVLASFLSDVQEDSQQLNTPISEMRDGAGRLVAALEADDEERAATERQALRESLVEIGEGSEGFVDQVAESLGVEAEGGIDRINSQLDQTELAQPDQALASARGLETSLTDFEEQLDRAQQLESALLVSPFGVKVEKMVEVTDRLSVFYAPAVLVLLVQHLAVTFAALSLVRERELGMTEIFRVSPLSVGETLIGKYLAFVVIIGVVGATLLATMTLFGVPVATSLLLVGLSVLLVILASLGLGFLISGISKSGSQAIQYSMIVLLVSIFFTGFILPLEQLIPQVQWVAYLIPATYGIQALQDIMFRGFQPDPVLIAGLVFYVLGMAVAAWVATRRDVTEVMG